MTSSRILQFGIPFFKAPFSLKHILSGFAMLIFTTFAGISGENPDRTFDYKLVYDGTTLTFDDHQKTIDMGNVRQGAVCQRTVKVKNVSEVPLWITNVRGSCGLSIPTWPRAQLQPGSSGVITIRYDSSRPGEISRNLTIVANTHNASTIIKVTGMVLKPEFNP